MNTDRRNFFPFSGTGVKLKFAMEGDGESAFRAAVALVFGQMCPHPEAPHNQAITHMRAVRLDDDSVALEFHRGEKVHNSIQPATPLPFPLRSSEQVVEFCGLWVKSNPVNSDWRATGRMGGDGSHGLGFRVSYDSDDWENQFLRITPQWLYYSK